MGKTNFLLIVPLFILLISSAEAAMPRDIAYTVKWSNTSGQQLQITHTNVNFTIFDLREGGRILDTRLINVTTNNDGLFPINYTISSDTDTNLWLAINNTYPRIFMAPPIYSTQFLKSNESNTINSTLTLSGNGAKVSGLIGQFINATSGLNASAINYGIVPQGVLDTARTWTTVQTFTNNITHNGLLVNDTGGVNASKIGFGTVPQGVLDSARAWTVQQNFTAGATFGSSLNVSGAVNITGRNAASVDNAFSVFDVLGFRTFNVDVFSAIVSIGGQLNITAEAVNNALAVRGPSFVEVFRVDTIGAGMIHTQGTLNVTNVTHQVGGLLINTTGGINASAVGFGTIPQGVNQVYNNTGYTGGRVVFGKAIGIVHASNGAEVIVNMSTGFSCTACYSVVASLANSTTSVGSFIIINVNASQFNLTYRTGAAPEFLNTSWIAVGY